MAIRTLNKAIVTVILLFFLPNVTNAGWVISEVSTDQHGNKYNQTTFIQDHFIRHETPSSIAIIDLNKQIITIVFSQYRVYWSGTTYELKQNSIDAYDKQMEDMMAGLPPAARNELDSIYAQLRCKMLDTTSSIITNNNIKFIETTEVTEMLGFTSRRYDILIDDKRTESIWHTDEIKPYSGIDINNMISFMTQLVPAYGNESVSQTREYLDLLNNGLLLKSVEYLKDSNTFELNVTNVKEVNIIADFFAPPKNYRKASFSDILNLMPVLEEEENDDW
jgi:hypothetical protein